MSEVITCPTGLSGRLRKMRVGEQRILSDRKLARSGQQLDKLLEACWEETVDPGPYELGDARMDWGSALQGDSFYALLSLRVLTYGAVYPFSVTCREESCRGRIDWEFDLTELPVRALSDESRAVFVAGNRFETLLPDANKRAWFKLPRARDEGKLSHIRRTAGDESLPAELAFQVLEVDGVETKHKQQFFRELSLGDVDFLADEIDRVGCGVDTEIEIECPRCYALQDVDIPFDKRFFMPEKGRAARRKQARISSSRG